MLFIGVKDDATRRAFALTAHSAVVVASCLKHTGWTIALQSKVWKRRRARASCCWTVLAVSFSLLPFAAPAAWSNMIIAVSAVESPNDPNFKYSRTRVNAGERAQTEMEGRSNFISMR